MYFEPEDYENLAVQKFESMLKTNETFFFDSEEFEDIANHYFDNGKIALAKKAIKMGLEQHPSNLYLKICRIEVLISEDKLVQAESLLDEISIYEHCDDNILIQKALISSRRNNHLEAIAHLEKALITCEDTQEVLSLMGTEYIHLEDYENALKIFKKCLENEPDHYGMIYNILFCLDTLDLQQESIDFLSEYLEDYPYSEFAWQQLGKIYLDIKDYEKALAAFDFAIISDDQFIGAYLDKGRVLEKQKRYEEAIASYLFTLTLDTPSSYALLRLGKCHYKLGNTQAAIDYFIQCIDEDPLLAKAWIAITDLYYKQKDYRKALYYIEKAVTIDSENVSYWKRYAKIHKFLDHYEEAEVGFRKTLELGNYELDSWLSRSDILIHLGEYEAAITNLNQALEFYPDHPEIEFRLSGLHYSIRDSQKGEYFLRNGLRNEPEYLMIVEELFPLVYRMKYVKQIVLQHQKHSL